MDEGGSRNGAFLSEEAQCGGPLGRASLLGTLEDMFRKALNTGISLCRGPFPSMGNMESGGGGGAHTGCPRRNGQNFGRVFLMLKYTDIIQNTYIQS